MMRRDPIREGDTVRVIGDDPNAGLEGTVQAVYAATADMERRAFVRFELTDGPYGRAYGLRYLEKVR